MSTGVFQTDENRRLHSVWGAIRELCTRALPLLAVVLAVTTHHASAQQGPLDPGVTVRIYEIAQAPERIPVVAEGQTPNHDSLRSSIDIGNDDFGNAVSPFVTHVIGQIIIDEAGAYDFRLTSDDGSRLSIAGEVVLDHDGRHAATSVEARGVELAKGAHDLFIEHFDGGGGRSLWLEWRQSDNDEYKILDKAHLCTEQDITRVTSPGIKRIEGGRRPGDKAPLIDVHPGWTLSTIRPEGYEPKVGAMTFLPDGRLVIGTFDPLQRDDVSLPDIESKEPDALYAIGNLDADDPRDVTITRIASDLYEPMGLCVVDDELYVAHRRAVERLRDNDGDGFYETHEVVGEGWEGWNYHQFAMGLIHRDGKLYTALSTAMAPPDWEGMLHNAGPNGPMRGCLIEIDIETCDTRVLAGGLRTPNGLGWTSDGAMIYLDNQGTWMPTNQLVELLPQRFYGHYNWTNFVPRLAERFPDGGMPSALSDYPRTPATVLMAQNEVNNSPTQPLVLDGGPYDGQLLVGELTAGGVRRVYLERVDGQLQGSLFRFTQGLESGVNRMAWGPDGSLYIGGMGAGGNWNWRGTQFGLQRLTPNGTPVFEMQRVEATHAGFRIHFTMPVDPAWLEDTANYEVTSWTYTPTEEYGGPKVDERAHNTLNCTASPDGLSVELSIDRLEEGRCYHIYTDPTSAAGDEIWSTEAWYTLNRIPRAEPIANASIAGSPITPDALGVGTLPPAGAVTLVRKGVAPSMRYEGKSYPARVWTQDDLIANDDSMAVGEGSGDLVSQTEFGDARLHIEWFSPPGGIGQFAGNSGVYLQDRYEIQVLGTHAGEKPPAQNEAGAIYNIKAADANASTGPGTWQAYDIWFRAPRFDNGKKIEDAHVTVYWNGELIHNDVALPHGTGSAKDKGESPAEGLEFQIGVLRLQDHVSAAEGPVRYRNVWIAPIEEIQYEPGRWTDLFDGDQESDWMIRGGNAKYELTDGVLTGTSVPHSPNTFYTTTQTFDDFELIYEVLDDPRLNSGVQIRSHVIGGADNRSGGLRGYQIEIDPSERAYSAGVYDEARRGWLHPLHTAPYARRAFRPGQLNEIRVVAQGPVIRTWINGVPASEVFDAADAEGHIGFQVHDVGDRSEPLTVRFRNARLRTLTPAR
ncbi:MAG: family 16 glycoside hydrolase [Phycisphaerales bacterium JB058]